jgi:hypothetical protein
MLNLTSTIPVVLTLVCRILVPSTMEGTKKLNVFVPQLLMVLTLVWRMIVTCLDVELDLHNARGPNLVWRMLAPYLDVDLDL